MNIATSIWEQESFFAPSDVIIVGGGLLGLWTAFELISAKPFLNITILEKGNIPTGASTRNAGFACFGSPGEMISDAHKMGETTMWGIVDMRYRGIQKIRQHFADNTIDFDNNGGYECYDTSTKNVKEIEERIVWLNEGMARITGNPNTFYWCNEKLKEFGLYGFDSMVGNNLEGGIHSGKLVHALIRKLQTTGVQILYGMQVKGWEKGKEGISINANEIALQTKQMIVCTNGFSSHLQNALPVEPARGQVLVTEPIDGLQLKGTFHYDEGYYYFRNLGNRLLIGGARNTDFAAEQSTELSINENIQSELERFAKEHILHDKTFTISHRWSGIMGFSENKLPVIQAIETGVYAAICCNGMGVALSPIIAEEICKRVG